MQALQCTSTCMSLLCLGAYCVEGYMFCCLCAYLF